LPLCGHSEYIIKSVSSVFEESNVFWYKLILDKSPSPVEFEPLMNACEHILAFRGAEADGKDHKHSYDYRRYYRFFDQNNNEIAKPVDVQKTPRRPNDRLRWKVMKRDWFKCVKCGATPATNSSVELHVDHIIPWSRGGETVLENLQTLCSTCNFGKSNLLDD